MTDFEARKLLWSALCNLYADEEFSWYFSDADLVEANHVSEQRVLPYIGVYKHIGYSKKIGELWSFNGLFDEWG